uniref:response regulator n=1 Tax=Thaumasiovibrio occultus TaxID=1891184 RepID=UPI000B36029D|nr:response regulator transcription factor [Thaumasiovibrio occultus]
MIRVLLADDHQLVREGLQARLERQSNIDVVGTVSNGKAAIDEAQRLSPDIVLCDVNMPELSGIDVLSALKNSDISVVLVSMHDNTEYIVNAMRLGAKGYILKDVPSQELITAIETVYQGNAYFSAAVSQRLFDSMNQLKQGHQDSQGLTQRERDVLTLIAAGECNKNVARQLNISVRTVETHRLRLKKKLGLNSTAGLVKYALSQGLIHSEEE